MAGTKATRCKNAITDNHGGSRQAVRLAQ